MVWPGGQLLRQGGRSTISVATIYRLPPFPPTFRNYDTVELNELDYNSVSRDQAGRQQAGGSAAQPASNLRDPDLTQVPVVKSAYNQGTRGIGLICNNPPRASSLGDPDPPRIYTLRAVSITGIV